VTPRNLIIEHCILHGIDATEQRIDLTVRHLENKFSKQEIVKALRILVSSHKWFPDVVTVAKQISGDDNKQDMAEVVTNKIMEAAASFSLHDTEGVRKFLGEEVWAIADRFNFEALTKLTYDQMSTTRAQLRNFVKSNIKNNQLALGEIANGRLTYTSQNKLSKPVFEIGQRIQDDSVQR
jgi:hypothetical protein